MSKQLVFIVRTEGDANRRGIDDYFHVLVRPAIVDSEAKHNDDCSLGSVSFPGSYGEWKELEYFQIYSQGNCCDSPRHLYAWQPEFSEPYAVRISDAERMVKVLRKLYRAEQRQNETDGYPANFGQYVARVTKTLGAKYILFPPPNGKQRWENGYRFHAVKLGGAVSRINELIRVWTEVSEKEEIAA